MKGGMGKCNSQKSKIKAVGVFCLTTVYNANAYFCLMKGFWIASLLVFSIAACNSNDTSAPANENASEPQTPVLSYTVVATYPHDTSSYTQGLEIRNGQMFEGTGNYGFSKLLEVDLKSGKPIKSIALDPKFFGEGITILHDTLYQLTWREKTVFAYDAKTFKKLNEFPLNTEGWGITNDGKNLIVSDGSSNLYFYEPGTFRLMRTQSVTEGGSLVNNLN